MIESNCQRPDSRTVRVTFFGEAIRAAASGILETALATFAILIAVKHFESGAAAKATLLSSLALGLVGGLFIVPLVAKLRWRVSHAAAGVQLVSMIGFLLAAWPGTSEARYLIGMCLGIGVIASAIPLQTHYLQTNFPENRRGRLFSISIVIRAMTALVFSWLIGSYLDGDIARYPWVILLYALAAGMAAAAQLIIPSSRFTEFERKPPFARSVGLFREDAVFARVIAAAMAMGLGVLSANALRVDYLVNPDHQLNFDARTVAFITGVVPSVTRLASTFFWGWLFDRMNMFRLRLIVNTVFFGGIFLFFVTGDVVAIAIGSALFGLARGGGEIIWNLWVTKLTHPDRTAEYMSIHTFLTGVRAAAAPFIGFYLVKLAGLNIMIAVSSAFIILSTVILWPLIASTKKAVG